MNERLRRRDFLRLSAGVGAGLVVEGCASLRPGIADPAGPSVLLDWTEVERAPRRHRISRTVFALGDRVCLDRFPEWLTLLRPRDQFFARVRLQGMSLRRDRRSGLTLLIPDDGRGGVFAYELPPQHVAEQAFPAFDPLRQVAHLEPAGPSYLVMRGLAARELRRLHVDDFASMDGLEVVDAGTVLCECGDLDRLARNLGGVPRITVLELPYGLSVSPVRRTHVIVPGEDTGAELAPVWHAHLRGDHVIRDSSVDPTRGDDRAPVEMAALDAGHEPVVLGVENAAPNVCDRAAIVENTLAPLRSRRSCDSPVAGTGLRYGHTVLSSFGAFLDAHGSWLRADGTDCGAAPKPDEVDEWVHRCRMGRDTFVKVSHPGMTNLGHRTSLQFIVRRTLVSQKGDERTGAPLICEWRAQIRDPLPLAYPQIEDGRQFLGREWPFVKADVWPKTTPPLFVDVGATPTCGGIEPEFVWLLRLDTREPFLFTVTAWDHAGRQHRFELPLFWVSSSSACHDDRPFDEYNKYDKKDTYKARRRVIDLGGDEVALVPRTTTGATDPASGGQGHGQTRARKLHLEMRRGRRPGSPDRLPPADDWFRPVFPTVREFELDMPELSAFDRPATANVLVPVRMTWHERYADAGFAAKENPREEFLRIPDGGLAPKLTFYGAGTGGAALPELHVGSVSRSIGLVGGRPVPTRDKSGNEFVTVDADAEPDRMDLQGIFGKLENAKLIGSIQLGDILRQIDGVRDALDAVPKLRKQVEEQVAPIGDAVHEIEERIQEAVNKLVAELNDVLREVETALESVDAEHGLHDVVNELADRVLAAAFEATQLEHLSAYVATEIVGTAVGDASTAVFDALELDASAPDVRIEARAAYARWRGRLERAGFGDPQLSSAKTVLSDALRKQLAAAFDDAFESSGLSRVRLWVRGDAKRELAGLRKRLDELHATKDVLVIVPAASALAAEFRQGLEGVRQALGEIPHGVTVFAQDLVERLRRAGHEALEALVASMQARLAAAETSVRSLFVADEQELEAFVAKLGADVRSRLRRELTEQLAAFAEVVPQTRALVARVREVMDDPLDAVRSEVERGLDAAFAALLGSKLSDLFVDVESLVRDVRRLVPKSITYTYDWDTRLNDWPDGGDPLFIASDGTNAAPATLKIHSLTRVTLRDGDQGPKADVVVDVLLRNFSVSIIPKVHFLVVGFEEFKVSHRSGAAPDVSVTLGRIEFREQLGFVKRLVDAFAGKDGLYFRLDPGEVAAGFRLKFPNIGMGAFSLTGLAVALEARIPFNGRPLAVALSVSSKNDPFIIQAGILGGGGWFMIALTPGANGGVTALSFGFEFGGTVAIDIGVASGIAYLRAGFAYELRDEVVFFTGFVRAGGAFTVLGIIELYVSFFMGMTYANGCASGKAEVQVRIKFCFFSISVTLTYEKTFSGGDQRPMGGGDDPDAPRSLAAARAFLPGGVLPQEAWDAWYPQFDWGAAS